MKAEIRWKQGYRARLSADAAFAEVEEIRKAHGGRVTPESVVDGASDRASPLHKAFEWNNRAAGHQYRLVQARKLLQSFVIVDTESDVRHPAFLNVVVEEADDGGRAYLPTAYVISRPELRERAVADALRGLMAWQRRHGAIAGFEPVHRAIKRVSRSLGKAERAAAP